LFPWTRRTTGIPKSLVFLSGSMKTSGAIEIFGLCGAGKTTILNDLASALQSGTSSLETNVSFPTAPGPVHSLCETLRITAGALRNSPREVSKFIANKNNWWLPLKLGYRSSAMKKKGDLQRVLLVDGGILQPFISFSVEYNILLKKVPTDPFLSALALPSHAVYVRTSPEVAQKRYLAREEENQRPVNKENLGARFAAAFEICEYLYTKCRSLGIRAGIVPVEKKVETDSLAQLKKELFGQENPQ